MFWSRSSKDLSQFQAQQVAPGLRRLYPWHPGRVLSKAVGSDLWTESFHGIYLCLSLSLEAFISCFKRLMLQVGNETLLPAKWHAAQNAHLRYRMGPAYLISAAGAKKALRSNFWGTLMLVGFGKPGPSFQDLYTFALAFGLPVGWSFIFDAVWWGSTLMISMTSGRW